jgi:hypothetical protein
MHLRDSWGRQSDSCCTDCTQNQTSHFLLLERALSETH